MFYSIQFLRGIAAIMVVLSHISMKGNQHHIDSLQWFKIGGSGVDLFFIISGFIMCYTTHDKNISTIKFLRNRLERIIPLYWLLSFFALIVFLVAPSLVNSSGGNTGVIESFFLIPNGKKFLIQNGWTLSYEFYYYFIFSLFICLTSIRFIRYIGISLTLLVLLFIGAIIKSDSQFYNFLTNNILLEFVFGIFAFYLFKNFKVSEFYFLMFVLIGIISLSYINFIGITNMELGRSLIYGLPMLLIFYGSIGLERYFSNTKSFFIRIFEHLGNTSYSLYLVHPFALSPLTIMFKKINLQNSYLFSSILLVGSLIIGSLTYIILEKPITNLIKRYRK